MQKKQDGFAQIPTAAAMVGASQANVYKIAVRLRRLPARKVLSRAANGVRRPRWEVSVQALQKYFGCQKVLEASPGRPQKANLGGN